MDKKYCVIVKTGDAELRAMQNLSASNLNKILPIVELTRGRGKNIGSKTKPNFIYPYEKKIEKVAQIFKDHPIALDVTSDINFSSREIDELFEPHDGYSNWVNKITSFNKEYNFQSFIPSVIMNYDDDFFNDNIRKQVEKLSSTFQTLMYRFSLENEIAIDDIKLISNYLPDSNDLLIVLDCGWIPAASYKNPAEICIKKVQEIKEALGEKKYTITICSTTFPNNISEIGDDHSDTFDLKEIDLFEMVRAQHSEVVYGDYGSINPIRNDQIVMARGWIPRIDVALQNKIYYYRKRRPGKRSAYADTYTSVARQAVSDSRFPYLKEEWGYSQIINCSLGDAPSASPSFWISVRMNSHIIQQILRLKI